MDLEKKVLDIITTQQLISTDEKVLIGVSGGIDSTALLFLLNNIKNSIRFDIGVAHVNHQLRGEESERDQTFVKAIADKLGLPIHLSRIDVKTYAHRHGLSTQHAGRDLRYRFFEELCIEHGYNRVAIAHNSNDQAETFLIRIIKGTGIHGLASIPMKRGKIIRPLLNIPRREIESYASAHGIAHVEDSSNAHDGYERNFIRNRIMPLIEELNPQAVERILSLLGDIGGINEMLDGQTDAVLNSEVRQSAEGILIDRNKVSALPEELRFRTISRILMQLETRFIPLREHIRLVEKCIVSARPNNSVKLPHNITVRRVYESLEFTKQQPPALNRDVFPVASGINAIAEFGITLKVMTEDKRPKDFGKDPFTAWFDADMIGDLAMRTFRIGDRFVPFGMKDSVKLKDFFISRKLPMQQRKSLPLLMSGNNIIWVVGQRTDERYKVTEHTSRFLKVVVSQI